MESANSFTIMFVGLGFFLLVSLVILRSERETYSRRERQDEKEYQRKLAEWREFGYNSNDK